MKNTSQKIIRISKNSKELNEIIDLWRKNSKTLGFFPEGAFNEYAANGGILAVISPNGSVAGYLAFRTVKRGYVWPVAVIVHLCIDDTYRGNGYARALINELDRLTKTNFFRIELRCRQDYTENGVWPHLGFTKAGEKVGKKGIPLDYWIKEHRPPPMFALWDKQKAVTKLQVVIDAMILFRLQEYEPGTNRMDRIQWEEVQSLQADWLQDEIELLVTKEIFVEISRNKDPFARGYTKKFASQFRSIEFDEVFFKQVEADLQNQFKNPENKESDIKQLAYAIAGGAHFFITQDNPILKKANYIESEYDIQVMPPGLFIQQLSELVRSVEFHPSRLAKSEISELPLSIEDFPHLYNYFRCNHKKETKNSLKLLYEIFYPILNNMIPKLSKIEMKTH
ncbi:MAG: GNAT family N-acetyltransferase [Anaerolineales bacterium]|nr:GNAT family N-acetyltransferase [Anaerolineales bacterium]